MTVADLATVSAVVFTAVVFLVVTLVGAAVLRLRDDRGHDDGTCGQLTPDQLDALKRRRGGDG